MARNKGGLETLRGSLIGVPGLDSNENLEKVCCKLNEMVGKFKV